LNIQEGKLCQPWFNANYFQCIVHPVYDGGLPAVSELKLRFKEGGAFEFSTIYRQLRERISETGELPQELEPLPAYSPPTVPILPQPDEAPPAYEEVVGTQPSSSTNVQ
jgi:hypothetical protein